MTRAVPCECGSTDAHWHGDTLRVYACDACWRGLQLERACAKGIEAGRLGPEACLECPFEDGSDEARAWQIGVNMWLTIVFHDDQVRE